MDVVQKRQCGSVTENLALISCWGNAPHEVVKNALGQRAFKTETCARHMTLTTTAALADLPDEFKDSAIPLEGFERGHALKRTVVEQGLVAYAYTLLTFCGLTSKNIGEHFILGQVRQSWNKYKGTFYGRELEPAVRALLVDAAMVREHILPDFKPPSTARAAVSLINPDKQKRVLLITDLGKGHMNGHARDIAHVLGRGNSQGVGQIVVSDHSGCKVTLGQISDCLNSDVDSHKIKVPVATADLSSALNHLKAFDAVFLVGKNSTHEHSNLRARLAAGINPQQKVISFVTDTDRRQDAELAKSHQISNGPVYENLDIMTRYLELHQQHRELIDKARQACLNFAILRSRGMKTNPKLFDMSTKDCIDYCEEQLA